MKKIRVLFTIPNFITAGSGREMFNIIERLDKTAFEPYVAVQQVGGALYDEIVAKGYPVLEHTIFVEPGKNFIDKANTIRISARYFRQYHFAIWQSFNWSSDYTEALIAKLAGAQYVYVKKNMNWNRRTWKIKSLLAVRIVARNSSMPETVFSKSYYKSKTVLITGAVDTDKFKPLGNKSLNEKYAIPADMTLVTCVAQLVRIKDQLTLIKAIAKVPQAYLILAGADNDKSYKEELLALIDALNLGSRAKLLGAVSTIPALLNVSDIFVLPTTRLGGHEEGCPVSVLEAMSVGVPVIASNVAGNRDLVENERTGLLFEPGDAVQLAACIHRYIQQPSFARQMADRAMDNVNQHHTLDKEAGAFETLYKTMLK